MYCSDSIIILLVFGAMTFFGGDSVEVSDIYLSNHLPHQRGGGSTTTSLLNSNSQAAYGVLKFSLVPKNNIAHIKEMRLENIEFSHDGYDTTHVDALNLKYKIHENNNIYLDAADKLIKDYLYSLFIEFSLSKDGLNYQQNEDALKAINHVKADIVVDTTTESDIVIGHIDSDVAFES